jgi:hypothetical protein
MKPLAYATAFLLTSAGLTTGCSGGSLSVGSETEGGSTVADAGVPTDTGSPAADARPVDAGTAADGSEGSADAVSGADAIAEIPAVCKLAEENVTWITGPNAPSGAIDCTQPTASPWPWAVGMGASWQDVFVNQCETALTSATCGPQGMAYYSCIAASSTMPTCAPCATPNEGECKNNDGVTYDTGCGNEEQALATCLCGSPDPCTW